MSSAKTPEDQIAALTATNRLLRARIAELEKEPRAAAGGQMDKAESRIFRLVKEKNRALDEYAARLERKSRELDCARTNLQEAEDEIARASLLLRLQGLALDHDGAAVVLADGRGKIRYCNRYGPRYLGREPEATVGCAVSEISLASPSGRMSFDALFRAALRDGEQTFDARLDDGSDVLAECRRLEDDKGVQGVLFRLTGA